MHAYRANIQSRFSRNQSLKRKISILYFRLLFSHRITPFPLVPPVTNHLVYYRSSSKSVSYICRVKEITGKENRVACRYVYEVRIVATIIVESSLGTKKGKEKNVERRERGIFILSSVIRWCVRCIRKKYFSNERIPQFRNLASWKERKYFAKFLCCAFTFVL